MTTWEEISAFGQPKVDQLEADLSAANQKVTMLTAELATTRADLSETRLQLAAALTRVKDLEAVKQAYDAHMATHAPPKQVYAHYCFWQHRASPPIIEEGVRAGLDGFMLEMTSTSGANWEWAKPFAAAVLKDGRLDLIPCLDTNGVGVGAQTPEVTAAAIIPMYKHANGTVVNNPRLTTFKAEGKPIEYWKTLLATLKSALGVDVKFMPLLLSAGTNNANLKAFAPIADSLSIWGPVKPANVASLKAKADLAHSLGCKWMAPVRYQDVRQRAGAPNSYAEVENTTLLRKMWEAATDYADSVQIVTWNDELETSHIWTHETHSGALLDLTKFYGEWFRTKQMPKITQDKIVLTHRSHPYAKAPASYTPTLDGTSVPRDTTEALVFATVAGAATVNGTVKDVPAGVTPVVVPLKQGTNTASFRGITLTSAHVVTDTPTKPIMAYRATAS